MKVVVCEQGTPEWFAARLGKVSASRVADVVAKTKTGWGASRANYAADLIAERLTGVKAESYSNAAMQWGTDNEPAARKAYEFMAGNGVMTVGIVLHPSISMSCASPDGLVGDDGLVEIKCPNTATHLETLLGAPVADKYVKQMNWQMACAGRAWCDFVSFDPRLPGEMSLHITRIARDDALIKSLEADVSVFLSEIADKVARLKSLYMLEAAE